MSDEANLPAASSRAAKRTDASTQSRDAPLWGVLRFRATLSGIGIPRAPGANVGPHAASWMACRTAFLQVEVS